MDLPLTAELKRWVAREIEVGRYSSEEAVLVAALKALRDQEIAPVLDDLLDLDFEEYCAREGDGSINLQQVLDATSKIPGLMSEAIIEEERAERS